MTGKLTLVHAPMSRSGMMMWILDELGADYEVREVSIRRRDGTGGEDPDNPHPHKQVPALIHEETVIWEQAAIAIYLSELFPGSPLVRPPGHRERGPFLAWLVWYAATFEPAMEAQVHGLFDANPIMRRTHHNASNLLIERLSEHPYLLGAEPTLPDFFLAGAMGYMRSMLPESDVLDAFAARMHNRPVALALREAP